MISTKNTRRGTIWVVMAQASGSGGTSARPLPRWGALMCVGCRTGVSGWPGALARWPAGRAAAPAGRDPRGWQPGGRALGPRSPADSPRLDAVSLWRHAAVAALPVCSQAGGAAYRGRAGPVSALCPAAVCQPVHHGGRSPVPTSASRSPQGRSPRACTGARGSGCARRNSSTAILDAMGARFVRLMSHNQ